EHAVGRDAPRCRLTGHADQGGEGGAERGGDPVDRAEARVGLAELDLGEHAPADVAPLAELCHAQPALGAQRADAPADDDRHLGPDPFRHASSDIASTCTASTSPAVSNIVLTPVCSPGCRPAAV